MVVQVTVLGISPLEGSAALSEPGQQHGFGSFGTRLVVKCVVHQVDVHISSNQVRAAEVSLSGALCDHGSRLSKRSPLNLSFAMRRR